MSDKTKEVNLTDLEEKNAEDVKGGGGFSGTQANLSGQAIQTPSINPNLVNVGTAANIGNLNRFDPSRVQVSTVMCPW